MDIVYTLPVPDATAESFIAAFAKQHGWTAERNVTTLEFSRMIINNFIRESVANELATQAAVYTQQQTIAALTTQFDGIASTLTLNT